MQKRVSACFLQSLKAQQAVFEKDGREEFGLTRQTRGRDSTNQKKSYTFAP